MFTVMTACEIAYNRIMFYTGMRAIGKIALSTDKEANQAWFETAWKAKEESREILRWC